MDKTKLRNVVSRFEEYLIVDHGLGKTTVEGYGRSLSIALRRMRKFVPSHQDIKRHVYWMHKTGITAISTSFTPAVRLSTSVR